MGRREVSSKKTKQSGKPIGYWVGGDAGTCCELPKAGRKVPYGIWYICPKGHRWQWLSEEWA